MKAQLMRNSGKFKKKSIKVFNLRKFCKKRVIFSKKPYLIKKVLQMKLRNYKLEKIVFQTFKFKFLLINNLKNKLLKKKIGLSYQWVTTDKE